MIVVRLMGGLGNQLFQYAAARRLAYKHDTSLKLDTSELLRQKILGGSDTQRFYELSPFNIEGDTLTIIDIISLNTFRIPRLVTIKESHFHFDPQILNLPDNVYLQGFWQSEKYFADIGDTIRQELTVKERPNSRNRQMLQRIQAGNAVGLHVRRGDYVTNPRHSQFHGLCSPEYYRKAIRYIGSRVQNPHFYVFSDDPEWYQDNMKTGFPTIYVGHNGPGKGYEDLRLMSSCKHFIIANSSFSWWGAWLSENKGKIVVAPKRWFAQPGNNTKDLLPRSWIKL